MAKFLIMLKIRQIEYLFNLSGTLAALQTLFYHCFSRKLKCEQLLKLTVQ